MLKKERCKERCSFCHKDRDKVEKLIASKDDVFICNECVELCCEILAEEGFDEFRMFKGKGRIKPRQIHSGSLDEFLREKLIGGNLV